MQEMQRAQRFVRVMVYFWNIITYLMLVLLTVVAFVHHPGWLHAWRGLALAGAVLLYGGWYSGGFMLVIGRHRAWQPEYLWRRVLYWVIQFGSALILMTFDTSYTNLLWVSLGTALSFIVMPWSALFAAIPAGIIIHSWGVWPNGSAGSWLVFISVLLTFAVYCAVVYMPMMLIQHRFTQARLYRDLEAAHAELAAAHAQLAASAEQERELAVLRERERLARDLHDTLGHALVLATVKLEAIRRLVGHDAERAERESEATQGILRDAMNDLRSTLVALRSSDLGGEPVAVTLARRAREVGRRSGCEVDMRLCSTSAEWPHSVQSALLHIGTEAIANVERHAQARHLRLSIIPDDGCACLTVADDGVGLPALPRHADGGVTSPSGHYGLAGMRERVAELGGTLAITSAPGQGTEISVRVPLARLTSEEPAREEGVYA